MMTYIREMADSDLPAVYDVETRGHSHPWTRGLIQDCMRAGYYCIVIENDAILAGFAIYSIAVGECHLLNICIAPEHQRKGNGRAMMEYIMRDAKYSAKQLYLEVRESNIAAIKLYEGLNFTRFGIRKDYYPDAKGRENAIMFRVDLG